MIDAITHAKTEGRPLMILSTDFSTAFDSITFNHIENSLRFMEFPDNFIRDFMKLVNNGTLQVEVNNSKSADCRILSGTGQGDPKSSYTFNCSVAPLNHLIANLPIIYTPFKPFFFADDNLIPKQGDRPQEILQLIRKIQQYKEVFEPKEMHVHTSQHDSTKHRPHSESNWDEKSIQNGTFRSYNEFKSRSNI